MLPLGILIPTRNSMAYLPAHVESMLPWLDLAQEIVVVDSESKDGTPEFLREKLAKYNVRFFNQPPGLYQAWNFGFKQVNARYTYVSTIGDAITRDGVTHLMEVAEKFEADVVISPPIFVDDDGRPTGGNDWPVHRLISYLDLCEPQRLEELIPFLLALTHFPFAILGSSASNVYRTEMIQKHPFPTDFGWNGDGAWGLFNALRARIAITPKEVSFFRKHPRLYAKADYETDDPDRRMLTTTLENYARARKESTELCARVDRANADAFIRNVIYLHRARSDLKRWRSIALFPWVLNPVAWSARSRRVRLQRACESWFMNFLSTKQEGLETRWKLGQG